VANQDALDPSPPILSIEIFKLFLPANPVPLCSIRLFLTPTETLNLSKPLRLVAPACGSSSSSALGSSSSPWLQAPARGSRSYSWLQVLAVLARGSNSSSARGSSSTPLLQAVARGSRSCSGLQVLAVLARGSSFSSAHSSSSSSWLQAPACGPWLQVLLVAPARVGIF